MMTSDEKARHQPGLFHMDSASLQGNGSKPTHVGAKHQELFSLVLEAGWVTTPGLSNEA